MQIALNLQFVRLWSRMTSSSNFAFKDCILRIKIQWRVFYCGNIIIKVYYFRKYWHEEVISKPPMLPNMSVSIDIAIFYIHTLYIYIR